jgi:hypothetical protein
MQRTQRRIATVRHLVAMIAVLLAGSVGCTGGGASPTTSTLPATTTPSLPDACNRVTTLFAVASPVDAPAGDCGQWIRRSAGRAVLGSTGSASVWSRNTGHGTALVVGAVHTLGEGWFGPAGTPIEEALWDPSDQIGVLRLHVMLPDGSGPDPLASPLFVLYNPAIAAERNGNLMQDVLPREDFFVAVTDSQKHDMSGPVPQPDPVVHGTVPLYDSSGVTLAAPTFADAQGGELVLLLGYPNTTRELSASVGRVLTDTEAAAAMAALADAGDPEGAVPYEAEVEVMIRGAALPGMSGGPVVDPHGRIVAVMVRASEEHDGAQYIRAVRMSYIASRLEAAGDALPYGTRSAIAGYLETSPAGAASR